MKGKSAKGALPRNDFLIFEPPEKKEYFLGGIFIAHAPTPKNKLLFGGSTCLENPLLKISDFKPF